MKGEWPRWMKPSPQRVLVDLALRPVVLLAGVTLTLSASSPALAEGSEWEFAFTAVAHGPRGSLLILDGRAIFDQARAVAWGGGSFFMKGTGGEASAGSWTVLNVTGWRLPAEQFRPDRDRLDLDLDLDLLVLMSPPPGAVSLASVS
jgi:hypothetical protein